jgi:7-carboxy-7-deazaguanine synthase
MVLGFRAADELDIAEIFGPTVQGEGTAAGQHCMFIRLSGCNLECTWCDTPYTWAFTPSKAAKHQSHKQYNRREEVRRVTSDTVLKELTGLWDYKSQPTMIVISGGEPLMQQDTGLFDLLYEFDEFECPVHIETAGTIEPQNITKRCVTQFNVSPKLQHSGNLLNKRFKPNTLRLLAATNKARFKFVVQSIKDLEEVEGIVVKAEIPDQWVQIMPEGTTSAALIDTMNTELIDAIIKRGWGISPRMHIDLWSDVRGR